MRLTLYMMFLICLTVSAEGYSQNVSISEKNVSLEKVFKIIEGQTGYVFFYDFSVLKKSKSVSIRVKNSTLEDVLAICFKEQPLTYTILNKTIVVKPKHEVVTTMPVTTEASIAPPPVEVTGLVKSDNTGEPLVGATVKIKSANKGTSTNSKGEFTISVEEGAVLIISNVGYVDKEIKIQKAGYIEIKLEVSNKSMNDVVITGVYKRPEGNFTGATTSISGLALKQVNSNNVFMAISALDPSFKIIPNNIAGGNINQLPQIQLRGANSFPNLRGELSADPNQPLFILDGFEVNLQRIADLDMNMIQTVTILKDASATSIYGSRGANGVLVITSVQPKSGKLQVTINNDFRVTTPVLSVYNLLNAKEKLDFENRSGLYTSASPNTQYQLDQIYNSRLTSMAGGANTNWLTIPVQTGISNRTSVYLQGGDSYIRYGLELSSDFQNGVMKKQNRNNNSGQFDLSYQANKIRFQNSIRIFQNTSNESPYGNFATYTQMNPYWRPYDAEGNVLQILESNHLGIYANPLFDATLNSVNKSQYFGISNNTQAHYDITPDLFIESNFSLNKQSGSIDQFFSAQNSRFAAITDITLKGSYTVTNNNSLGYESLTTLNFNRNFNKHLIFTTLGFNIASNTNSFYTVSAVGFPFDRLDNLLFAAQYTPNTRPSGDESTIRRLGILSNANYTYDNRYLADFSIRRDGSSQFGTDKRYGTFWSAGLGWNLHNEAFFVRNNYVNRLKIRGSYGSSGSLNIPAYRAQTRYNFGVNNVYDGQLGASIIGLGNTELSWQDVRTLNIGVDMSLLNQRLDVRFDYYKAITNNTITNLSLAPSTGFQDYAENLGKIQNTGYEASIRYKVINNKAKGFLWSVNVAGVSNKNILKELSNKLKATNNQLDAANLTQKAPNVLFNEGESINTIYVVKSLGVDPITGSEIFEKKDGTKTFIWNAADKVAAGITDPRVIGTFGSNLSYKGFEASIIFSYRFGGQIYNQTLVDKVQAVNVVYNADRRAYDRGWAKPGDQAMYTRITSTPTITRLTSRFVQDENNVTMTSVSLGYNFYKKNFLKKLGLKGLQLNAITNDLFTVSSIEMERGTSNPFARMYSLSVRATF